MNKPRFVLLTVTLDEDQWSKARGSLDNLQTSYPDGVVCIAPGIWIIDRTKAELALAKLVEQLHRIKAPFVVAPLSSPPTICATESELQQATELGIDFYPMPFVK